MSDYTLEKQAGCLQLTLTGDLTATNVPDLQTALRQALEGDVTEVVADLRNTAMLDSSGIGLLIRISNTLARRNGRIRVLNASADILRLFQSMRLAGRLNATGRET
jgi:anti-sigma B factor antagonist